jgi:hypothetical protein
MSIIKVELPFLYSSMKKTARILLIFDIEKWSKAELLQLKPHPFICMINFINKNVGN